MVLFFVGNVGAKCTYITSNYRQNGSSDQPFPITFSKNENGIYVLKLAFLANLERIFEKLKIRWKVIAISLNMGLVSPYNTPHARARRVILAKARSERHFKIQIGYFGFCQIPLNTEKITILAIFIYRRRGLTRLWRNLPIWVKIARFNPFFLMKVTISKP